MRSKPLVSWRSDDVRLVDAVVLAAPGRSHLPRLRPELLVMAVCAWCGGVDPMPWRDEQHVLVWYPDGRWVAYYNSPRFGWSYANSSPGRWTGTTRTYHGRSLPPPVTDC